MTVKIVELLKADDPLSPSIFSVVLVEIFKKVNWKNKGFQIKIPGPNLLEFKSLNYLRYADDVALIVKNGRELSNMVEDLRRASKEYGLSINMQGRR